MNELTKRVLVALWGVPLLLALSYLGGLYFLALVLIINAMALWEFYSIFKNQNINAYRWPGLILSTLLILVSFFGSGSLILVVFLCCFLYILIFHLNLTEPLSATNTAYTISGIIYISIFLISLLLVRVNFSQWNGLPASSDSGGRFLVLLWVSIWICDTLAYFGGKKFGKHKLAPRTSPNKTVEGAVFGFLGALLIFLPFGLLLLPNLPFGLFLVSGIIVGVLGQIGDLVESRFKRDAGVKDTSTLLPGHGGFLDRFDSLIFVSPWFFILFFYFGSGQ